MKKETQAKRDKEMKKFQMDPVDDDGCDALEELGGLEDSESDKEEVKVDQNQ